MRHVSAEGSHDNLRVDEDNLLDLLADSLVVIHHREVFKSDGVVNVDPFVALVVLHHPLLVVFDVNLRVNLIEQALQQRQVHKGVVINLAIYVSLGDAGPHHPFKQVESIDSAQVVVDSLKNSLLLTNVERHRGFLTRS